MERWRGRCWKGVRMEEVIEVFDSQGLRGYPVVDPSEDLLLMNLRKPDGYG
jgi:hypothetical protein